MSNLSDVREAFQLGLDVPAVPQSVKDAFDAVLEEIAPNLTPEQWNALRDVQIGLTRI